MFLLCQTIGRRPLGKGAALRLSGQISRPDGRRTGLLRSKRVFCQPSREALHGCPHSPGHAHAPVPCALLPVMRAPAGLVARASAVHETFAHMTGPAMRADSAAGDFCTPGRDRRITPGLTARGFAARKRPLALTATPTHREAGGKPRPEARSL